MSVGNKKEELRWEEDDRTNEGMEKIWKSVKESTPLKLKKEKKINLIFILVFVVQ